MQLKPFSSSQGLSQYAHKKLRFLPGIVYIDGKLNKEYHTLNGCNHFRVHVGKFLSCLKWIWPKQFTMQSVLRVFVPRGWCCRSVCGGETEDSGWAAGYVQSNWFPLPHCASGTGQCGHRTALLNLSSLLHYFAGKSVKEFKAPFIHAQYFYIYSRVWIHTTDVLYQCQYQKYLQY